MGLTPRLLAIDPGKTTGWAQFNDGGLVEAVAVGSEDLWKAQALPDSHFSGWGHRGLVLIECPRIYPHGGKGDPNGLIDLAVLVGELKGMYSDGPVVQLVFPKQWKGSVPKDKHNKRILSKLTPEELQLLPKRPRAKDYDHNMVDAIGLGLWKLGRL